MPQILVGNEGDPKVPNGKIWFQAYLGLGVTHVEKHNGYIHVFMCIQANDSSADFSWLHMQSGSRNPPKPEVIITRRREDSSTWSQRLWYSFRARPIHFHMHRHRSTMQNTIRYKTEVEIVAQTGSTNNLETESDIDAISKAIPMFFFWGGAGFSLVYMPTSPDASCTLKFNMADGYRK